MRKPFWKPSHKAWYCYDENRKLVKLGKADRKDDKEAEQAAYKEYHRLMAGQERVTSRTTAVQLIEQFLAWTQKNKAPTTYDWYLNHCQRFADFIGPKLAVADVTPNHVDRCLDKSYADCGDSHKNGACRAIARVFNWAKKQKLITGDNPIAGMERPPAAPREVYLTPDQWAQVIAEVKPDDPFADLLWFLKETGCRPIEARIVEARHWDRDKARFVLERKNSKGKKERRVICLNEKATAIVKRLALKYPDGPLFRNTIGRRWTKDTVICRFSKLAKKLGFAFFPYIFRHTWITDALKRGVDPLTVAVFAGHKDAGMVMRVYSHVAQDDEHLGRKLKQATGETDAA